MLGYAIRQVGLGIVFLTITMTVMYTAVYLFPGDPASIALGNCRIA